MKTKLLALIATLAVVSSAHSTEVGFVYDGGTFTDIAVPGSTYTNPSGINNAGQIVGYYQGGPSPYADGFVYNSGSYATLDVPGGDSTYLNSINTSGQIVANAYALPNLSYLYSGGSFNVINNVPGVVSPNYTLATGINDSGQIVGSYQLGGCSSGGPVCGFLNSGGTYSSLSPPSAHITQAYGINNLGQIVGSYIPTNSNYAQGFLLSNGTYTTIDVPGALDTNPYGINNLGQIVGSYEDSSGFTHGFLLSNDIFTTIDGPSATYTVLYGINDTDQIVGQYQFSSDSGGTPLPAALPLFATGLGALGLLGWRRNRKSAAISPT